jgi:hypothetical protein
VGGRGSNGDTTSLVASNTSVIAMGMPQWQGQSPKERQNFQKKISPEKIFFLVSGTCHSFCKVNTPLLF